MKKITLFLPSPLFSPIPGQPPRHRGDFHWYRLDSDGKWSHKPGRTRVTQYDNAGHYITDPRDPSVNMGRYRFVCFMSTDVNTVNIR